LDEAAAVAQSSAATADARRIAELAWAGLRGVTGDA
jgi:hypothetical protein